MKFPHQKMRMYVPHASKVADIILQFCDCKDLFQQQQIDKRDCSKILSKFLAAKLDDSLDLPNKSNDNIFYFFCRVYTRESQDINEVFSSLSPQLHI